MIESTLTRAERDDWVGALRSGEYPQFHGGWAPASENLRSQKLVSVV